MKIKTKIAIASVIALFGFQVWAFTQVPEAAIFMSEPAVPDLRAGGYTAGEVRELMLSYGEEGRATYIAAQTKVDFAIPALGALMFVTVFWALGDGLRLAGRTWSLRGALAFAVIGLIGPLFDLSENLLIRGAMQAGPEAFDFAAVELASASTTLKFSFMGAYLVIVLVMATTRWRQQRSGGVV